MDKNKDLIVTETFNLAVKNHQNNNLKEAQDLYNQILKVDPKYIDAYNNLGLLFESTGKDQKAMDCYKKAIEINPNYVNAHTNLGNVFKTLGEKQKAIDCYEKAIKIKPNYDMPHNNLGVIFQDLNQHKKAMDCYEKAIEINPNYSKSHNNLGVIFQNLGYYQKGVNCYKKAIEIDPNFIDAHYNLGGAFKKLDEYQKSIDCYKKAIKINPNYADAHYNLGLILRELGKYQKAMDCYKNAIEINPNYVDAYNNLGGILLDLEEYQKAKNCFEKALEIDPNNLVATINFPNIYIYQLIDLDKIISLSFKSLKLNNKTSKFINQTVPLFRLKHDVQQAQYLIEKDYKLEGIKEFQNIGGEILDRSENIEDENNSNQKILLTQDEINTLLPFYKSDHVYKPKKISGSCINPNKNWQDVEDEYFNSSNQIMYIDDFLSEEALQELREFCLVSKVWNREFNNKYLGAFGDQGFISPIHLQIAIDLKQKLPKLFGPHRLSKFWGFKYDSKLGKGINIHADFAIHNLNFWITPDEYNNNKNSGGLKVYDAPAPDNWTFKDYNINNKKIYKFLKDNDSNCTNVTYKCNRAVLFNSAYFHETDEIDFKDVYEGRRINNTYLFGNRLVK